MKKEKEFFFASSKNKMNMFKTCSGICSKSDITTNHKKMTCLFFLIFQGNSACSSPCLDSQFCCGNVCIRKDSEICCNGTSCQTLNCLDSDSPFMVYGENIGGKCVSDEINFFCENEWIGAAITGAFCCVPTLLFEIIPLLTCSHTAHILIFVRSLLANFFFGAMIGGFRCQPYSKYGEYISFVSLIIWVLIGIFTYFLITLGYEFYFDKDPYRPYHNISKGPIKPSEFLDELETAYTSCPNWALCSEEYSCRKIGDCCSSLYIYAPDRSNITELDVGSWQNNKNPLTIPKFKKMIKFELKEEVHASESSKQYYLEKIDETKRSALSRKAKIIDISGTQQSNKDYVIVGKKAGCMPKFVMSKFTKFFFWVLYALGYENFIIMLYHMTGIEINYVNSKTVSRQRDLKYQPSTRDGTYEEAIHIEKKAKSAKI